MAKPDRTTDLLLLAGKVIAIFMQGAMVFGAIVLIAVVPLIALLGAEGPQGYANGVHVPIKDIPILPLLGIMLIGLGIVACLFLFFGRLRAIIATVGEGDPFAPVNATRLSQMAWLMLGTKLLVLPAIPLGLQLAAIAEQYGEEADIQLDGGFDLSGILLVIILFILARVFRHGAAMREDLEGTV
jgi:ABC-type transport system involved in multi-copper enzyme maturation permease subunit